MAFHIERRVLDRVKMVTPRQKYGTPKDTILRDEDADKVRAPSDEIRCASGGFKNGERDKLVHVGCQSAPPVCSDADETKPMEDVGGGALSVAVSWD